MGPRMKVFKRSVMCVCTVAASIAAAALLAQFQVPAVAAPDDPGSGGSSKTLLMRAAEADAISARDADGMMVQATELPHDVHLVQNVADKTLIELTHEQWGVLNIELTLPRTSEVWLEIDIDAVPVMDEALAMYRKGMNTGSNDFNRRLVAAHTGFSRKLPFWHEQIFYDPQTSGGLLVSVPGGLGQEISAALQGAGVGHARVIGRVGPVAGDVFLYFA